MDSHKDGYTVECYRLLRWEISHCRLRQISTQLNPTGSYVETSYSVDSDTLQHSWMLLVPTLILESFTMDTCSVQTSRLLWCGTVKSLNSLSSSRAELAQWLERRTRDRKIPDSSPWQEHREKFLLQGQLLLWYPFHPSVTAVARKTSRSVCQKYRWQVTAKHICTLPMWLWMKWHRKLAHGWMVYTELALKRQQFHVAPATSQPVSAVSKPLGWMFIQRIYYI